MYEKVDCKKPSSERQYELCQHWYTAKAAQEATCIARRQWWLSVIGAVLGLLGFGGLVATVIFTALTAKAASESANVAKEALTKLERAFVLINAVVKDGASRIDGVDSMAFKVELENSGASPTQHLRQCINFKEFFPSELGKNGRLPQAFPFGDGESAEESRAVIGPKGKIRSGALHIPFDMLERMSKGQSRGYLWGWVEYDDIFDGAPRHRTEYCYYTARVTPPVSDVKIEWAAYREHNGMDDECPPERFRTAKGGKPIKAE